MVVRGWGQEKGKMSVKGCEVSDTQNECVLGSHVQLGDCNEQYCITYVKFAERVNPKCSQHTQKVTCEVMDRLISLIVVVTSKCIHMSKHQAVHLKITQRYTSFLP